MFFTNSVFLFLGLSLAVLGADGHAIADFIVPCPINDDVCLLSSALKAMPNIVNGHEKLGIPSADPMHFDNIDGNNGELKLAFKDLLVKGASKCKITKLERSDKHSAKFHADCPIKAEGKYILGGNLGPIAVDGDGVFKFQTEKITLVVTLKLKTVTGKDGEEYYKIIKFDYTYDPEGDVVFVFENLYNGNKEKAESLNQFIKENAKHLLNNLGKPVIKEIIKKVVSIVDSFFTAVPVKQLEVA